MEEPREKTTKSTHRTTTFGENSTKKKWSSFKSSQFRVKKPTSIRKKSECAEKTKKAKNKEPFFKESGIIIVAGSMVLTVEQKSNFRVKKSCSKKSATTAKKKKSKQKAFGKADLVIVSDSLVLTAEQFHEEIARDKI